MLVKGEYRVEMMVCSSEKLRRWCADIIVPPFIEWCDMRADCVCDDLDACNRTNHLSEGETHVPKKASIPSGGFGLTLKESLGKLFGFVNIIVVLVFGWPAYLIGGASGGTQFLQHEYGHVVSHIQYHNQRSPFTCMLRTT